jgi:mono/diheme cytochrome c family protein
MQSTLLARLQRRRQRLNLLLLLAALLTATACDNHVRKSDAELGLTAQQASGRRIFDNYCARCHRAYSARDLQGPSLKGMFRKPYLSSGLPANDDRAADIIRLGRSKMPGYDQILNQKQMNDLLAYLHTL